MNNWTTTTTARPGCQCARRSLLPNVNVAAATSISHGSRRRKLESDVRTSSSAPASPPARLATQCSVTTRTIRRDLQALEEAGFPIYDDKSRDDGKTRWVLNGQAFKGLSTGLTLAELCALYFSRSLAESLAGTPFKDDVESAFEKLTSTLTPHILRFLDQLPRLRCTQQP